MKLFVVAALIAVAAAGRLEHLERSYLPPDSSNSLSGGFNSNGGSHNGFGSGNLGASARGSQGFNQGSNGFGNHGSNGFGNQGSNGFGNQGSNGLNNGFSSQGSSGAFNSDADNHGPSFGSNGLGPNGALNAASLKQYLPPDHASSGFPGSSIKPSCTNCGFARQQYTPSQYAQAPSTQYGQPQFGASPSFNNFGARATFGQDSATNRQYLAPKSQELPQQPFDEQTGYHY